VIVTAVFVVVVAVMLLIVVLGIIVFMWFVLEVLLVGLVDDTTSLVFVCGCASVGGAS